MLNVFVDKDYSDNKQSVSWKLFKKLVVFLDLPTLKVGICSWVANVFDLMIYNW